MTHEQGTPEWFAERLGNLTASRMADATATTKTGWGASRYNLMAELIAERLTGQPSNGYTNPIIERGKEIGQTVRCLGAAKEKKALWP